MAKVTGKVEKETEGSSGSPPPLLPPPLPPPPKTPWELVITLLWYPPWKRWFLIPLVISIAAVNAIGYERLFAMAEDAGLVASEEIKCWNKTLRPADSHIAGMRVVDRSSTLDLSDWKAASGDDLARKVPIELAISRNRFLIERTDGNQGCFIHRMGTSSGIEPTVHCSRCRKVALPYKEGLPLREWDLVFDIQHQPIGQEIPIVFSVDFWNAFQRPDQWWGGFRVLHSTEKAIYTVIFPDEKKPKADSVQYRFVRSASQRSESMVIQPMDLEIRSEEGLTERVTWTVTNPQPDRSYRVYWAW